MEQFANEATALLSGAITSSATSLTVTSAVHTPTTGTFRCRIDSEYLIVTAVSGSTWTVTRGDGGTTGAAHAASAPITLIVTAEALNALVTVQAAGTEISNRRVLNLTGATVTDDSTNKRVNIVIPNGYEALLTKPVAASYVWLNQGTATAAANAEGAIFVRAPAASGRAPRGYMIAVPSTPYTITLKLIPCTLDVDFHSVGCGWASSSGTVFQALLKYKNAFQINLESYTAFTSTDVDLAQGMASEFTWFQLADNGTNRTFKVGVDGENWVTLGSFTSTYSFTPTHVGVVVESNNATYDAAGLLASWKQT